MQQNYGRFFQFAYVVEDMKAAIDHWVNEMGVGPFFMFPLPLALERLERNNEVTTEWDILEGAALAYSGDVQIELLCPGRSPSPYRDFLAAGRSGLHHLGAFATDFDAQIRAARSRGIKVAMQGVLPISRFAYLETDNQFPGTMVELIEPSQTMLGMFDGMKLAAQSWDGRDPVRNL